MANNDMSNLMKIFVQDDEDNVTPAQPPSNGSASEPQPGPPPQNPFAVAPTAAIPEPEPEPEPHYAEVAAAQLQEMITGDNDSAQATTQQPEQPKAVRVASPVSPFVPQPQPPNPAQAPAAAEPAPAPVPETPVPVAETPAAPVEPVPVEATPHTELATPPEASPAKDETFEAVYEALRTIAEHVEALPNDEDANDPLLRRIGSGGLRFVEQALDVADRQSGILPRSFDLETFRAEGQTLRNLSALSDELQKLTDRVSAAEATVCSGAFGRALSVYQAAKLSNASSDMENYLA
ncbi:MAG: hypothetical protein AAF585_09050 [Verrucomicrobiota bacterium]